MPARIRLSSTHHTTHYFLVILESVLGMHNLCRVQSTTHDTIHYCLVILESVLGMHNVCRVQTNTHRI